jgi:hypothetical protein
LDLEQVKQSDTWALASPELRPWLYMLWCESWLQSPCGSMPADPDVLAARLGMQRKMLDKHRAILMRGWWEASDGRLYHDTIVARVQAMVLRKDAERQRKADYRARMDAERKGGPKDVPRDKAGTGKGQAQDSGGRDDTGTGTGTKEIQIPSEANASGGEPPNPPTPQEMVWALGVPLLTAAGVKESNARSFLAAQAKAHGPQALVSALERCASAAPVEPVGWLQNVLKPKASRHVGFEAKNYREGITADGHLT